MSFSSVYLESDPRRRFTLQTLPPIRPPRSSRKSHRIIPFADPHLLTPIASIFYKNMGGRGSAIPACSALRREGTGISALCSVFSLFAPRVFHNSLPHNGFRTLSKNSRLYPNSLLPDVCLQGQTALQISVIQLRIRRSHFTEQM